MYEKQGKLDEAVREFQEAIRLDSSNASAHINLGNIYGIQGKINEAEKEFKEALIIDPENADANYNLALVYKKQDRYIDAINQWKAYVPIAFKTPGHQDRIDMVDKLIKDLEDKLNH